MFYRERFFQPHTHGMSRKFKAESEHILGDFTSCCTVRQRKAPGVQAGTQRRELMFSLPGNVPREQVRRRKEIPALTWNK